MNSLTGLPRRAWLWVTASLFGFALIGPVTSASLTGAKSHTLNETVVLRPTEGTRNDAFGFAVDIKGDLAVIGAAEDSEQHTQSGAVYIFERDASDTWIETAKLLANDAGPCHQFGSSVALDGNTLVIGQRGVACTEEDVPTPGSIYVFTRRGSHWVQSAKLQPPPSAAISFAFFTALDRDVALAGQEQNAYAYRRQANGEWSEPVALPATASVGDDDYSGPRLDVSAGTIVLGSTSIADTAFVDIYRATAHQTWRRSTTITLPRPGTDFWGRPHVAIEGNVLLADRFVYERKGDGSWRRTAALLPSDAPDPEEFPSESALSTRGIAVLTAFEFIGEDSRPPPTFTSACLGAPGLGLRRSALQRMARASSGESLPMAEASLQAVSPQTVSESRIFSMFHRVNRSAEANYRSHPSSDRLALAEVRHVTARNVLVTPCIDSGFDSSGRAVSSFFCNKIAFVNTCDVSDSPMGGVVILSDDR